MQVRVSARATPGLTPGWLVVAAIAAVGGGVVAGILVTGGPRPAPIPGAAEPHIVTSAPTRMAEPTRAPGVDLPIFEPLAPDQFVVPRGIDQATQLNLTNVSGVVPPQRLSSAAEGRNSWPVLSQDRRTIIYSARPAASPIRHGHLTGA
jgi:hypothetical protein